MVTERAWVAFFGDPEIPAIQRVLVHDWLDVCLMCLEPVRTPGKRLVQAGRQGPV
jgi:hypothetical protein